MDRVTMSDEELMRFVLLHKHWVAADPVQYHLRRSLGSEKAEEMGLPSALEAFAR